jgi:Tol biopolymer transport system component
LDAGSGRAGDPLPITTGANLFVNLRVSPDGQWLAFGSEAPSPQDIFVMRVDGSERRMLTDDPHKDRIPDWSPDGSLIGFYSERSGRYEIWTVRPDGRDLRQLTRTDADSDRQGSLIYPRWSPDGTRMSAWITGGEALLLDLDSEGNVAAVEQLPPMPDPNLDFIPWSWAPDGTRLVGHARSSGAQLVGVWSYTLATDEYRLLVESGRSPIWLSDGRTLVFMDRGKLYILDPGAHEPRELLSLEPATLNGNFHVSSDDRWLFFAKGDDEADLWLLSLD